MVAFGLWHCPEVKPGNAVSLPQFPSSEGSLTIQPTCWSFVTTIALWLAVGHPFPFQSAKKSIPSSGCTVTGRTLSLVHLLKALMDPPVGFGRPKPTHFLGPSGWRQSLKSQPVSYYAPLAGHFSGSPCGPPEGLVSWATSHWSVSEPLLPVAPQPL